MTSMTSGGEGKVTSRVRRGTRLWKRQKKEEEEVRLMAAPYPLQMGPATLTCYGAQQPMDIFRDTGGGGVYH